MPQLCFLLYVRFSFLVKLFCLLLTELDNKGRHFLFHLLMADNDRFFCRRHAGVTLVEERKLFFVSYKLVV